MKIKVVLCANACLQAVIFRHFQRHRLQASSGTPYFAIWLIMQIHSKNLTFTYDTNNFCWSLALHFITDSTHSKKSSTQRTRSL